MIKLHVSIAKSQKARGDIHDYYNEKITLITWRMNQAILSLSQSQGFKMFCSNSVLFMDGSTYSVIQSKAKGCSLLPIQQRLKSSACSVCCDYKNISKTAYIYIYLLFLPLHPLFTLNLVVFFKKINLLRIK